ncbi:MAG: ATP-grasp domain-containing protein [Atopobiaceae bacterium]|nr:ATP-grasp domain-containing protein [Atopobiaceae bacterium]
MGAMTEAERGSAQPLAGKTILLLGGSDFQVPAIECAKRLGLRTVLCDYLPDNPGQYVADVFYQKSTTDRELMLEVARAENADGVLSFCSDVALPSAAYVAEQLGLATNPLSSVEILSKKQLFHPYLAEHGFACPHLVSFPVGTSPAEVIELVKGLEGSIVIKPTDSSGSKGVTRLDKREIQRVSEALDAAAEYSRNGVLVAEEFIEYEYPHLIGGDIFVKDGRVVFWGLMSCLRDNEVASLVPVGKAYPAGLSTEQEQAVHEQLQALVTSLGLRFGEMNIEVIIGRGGKPYILECGGRAGGNMIPLELTDISGIDLVEANVRFAMGDTSMDLVFDGGDRVISTYVLHSGRDGVFEGVDFSPQIAPHVYRKMIHAHPGDRVERLTNGAKAFGQVFLRFDTSDQMWDMLGHIKDHIRVNVG